MNKLLVNGLALLAVLVSSVGSTAPAPAASPKAPAHQDPQARALLDAAKAKMLGVRSLVADFQFTKSPTELFVRGGQMFLERPNRFRIETISGAMVEERGLAALSDGTTVIYLLEREHVIFEKPVRPENFFSGQSFLVQMFFDPRDIRFDPAGATWGRAISLFDTNLSAYDRDTKLTLVGTRVLEDRAYDVVEIKYNTFRNDIRQQIYIGKDKFVYQVDTYFDGNFGSEKFRNFRVNDSLPADTWRKQNPTNMPVVRGDPVRMGAPAPEFTLPGHNGGEYSLKQMLQGKKGIYLCTLDGAAAKASNNADVHLPQMKVVQEMKNKFEKQGLVVAAIIGGATITPDLKEEMLMNWLPDLTRFNYPVLIDVDVERGIQGSAFPNFHLNGRNNLLLDAKGRVVFAAQNFDRDKVNQLALYQALGQIGFAVSAADLESAAR